MVIKKKIDKVIQSGEKVLEETSTYKMISMRMPEDFLEIIDNHVKTRIGMNRTSWILEACRIHLVDDASNFQRYNINALKD